MYIFHWVLIQQHLKLCVFSVGNFLTLSNRPVPRAVFARAGALVSPHSNVKLHKNNVQLSHDYDEARVGRDI